jgi:hypothetical protein
MFSRMRFPARGGSQQTWHHRERELPLLARKAEIRNRPHSLATTKKPRM